MAYRNNDGCGCMFIIVCILFAAIVSGIRGCINGDIKFPKLGSSHVRGGSGGHGTSSGYNVEYKQTTRPKKNGSTRDYTHTSSGPTEYRVGKQSSPGPTSSGTTRSTSNYDNGNNHSRKDLRIQEVYKSCEVCGGRGEIKRPVFFYPGMNGVSCKKCGRSDQHSHEENEVCFFCHGSGRVPKK